MENYFNVKYCDDCRFCDKIYVGDIYKNKKGKQLKRPIKKYQFYCTNLEATRGFSCEQLKCEIVRERLCGYFAKFYSE